MIKICLCFCYYYVLDFRYSVLLSSWFFASVSLQVRPNCHPHLLFHHEYAFAKPTEKKKTFPSVMGTIPDTIVVISPQIQLDSWNENVGILFNLSLCILMLSSFSQVLLKLINLTSWYFSFKSTLEVLCSKKLAAITLHRWILHFRYDSLTHLYLPRLQAI